MILLHSLSVHVFAGDDGDDAVGERSDPVNSLDRPQHSNLHCHPDSTTEAGNDDLEAEKVSFDINYFLRSKIKSGFENQA